MEKRTIKTRNGVLEIELPTSLSEITLDQAIKLSEVDEDIVDQQAMYEELVMWLELGEKDDGTGEMYPYDEELFEMDVSLLEYQMVLKIIKKFMILCPDVTEKQLRSIPEATLIAEYTRYTNNTTVEGDNPIVEFDFPIACKSIHDEVIEEYNEFLDILDKLEVKTSEDLIKQKTYEKRLEALDKGTFIIHPLRDIIFGGYMNVYDAYGNLPITPEQISSLMEEEETFKQYAERLSDDEELQTPDQRINRMRQKHDLKKYLAEYETGSLKVLPKIIAHICVPKFEDYDNQKADNMSQHFLSLPMDIVNGIRSFFFWIGHLSTPNLELYSNPSGLLPPHLSEKNI